MKFSASDVEKVCGVKRHRLFSWVSSGFIEPSIQAAVGSGTKNLFSAGDLFCITFFRKGVEAGLSRKALAIYMPPLQYMMNADDFDNIAKWDQIASPSYLTFYLDEKGDVLGPSLVSKAVEKGFLMPDYAKEADLAISINQSKILREVSKKIKNLNK